MVNPGQGIGPDPKCHVLMIARSTIEQGTLSGLIDEPAEHAILTTRMNADIGADEQETQRRQQ